MFKLPIAVTAAIVFVASSVSATAPGNPYAGWQGRAVKALSEQQLDDLREGRGMSLALAAELNGYPGPRHVLDLAGPLQLSGEQVRAIEHLFAEMQNEARALGAQIIKQETVLEMLFRSASPEQEVLEAQVQALGRLRGALRYTHLRYHVSTKALMSAQQVARYSQLRGYGSEQGDHDGSHGRH